jgi:hypothetical protein
MYAGRVCFFGNLIPFWKVLMNNSINIHYVVNQMKIFHRFTDDNWGIGGKRKCGAV